MKEFAIVLVVVIVTSMMLQSCESKSEVKAKNPKVMIINNQYNKELRQADSIQFLCNDRKRGIEMRIQAIKKRNLQMSKVMMKQRFDERWSSK